MQLLQLSLHALAAAAAAQLPHQLQPVLQVAASMFGSLTSAGQLQLKISTLPDTSVPTAACRQHCRHRFSGIVGIVHSHPNPTLRKGRCSKLLEILRRSFGVGHCEFLADRMNVICAVFEDLRISLDSLAGREAAGWPLHVEVLNAKQRNLIFVERE